MQVEKFKLYHFPATRSARVKWLLHEILDDQFEIERVELFQGEQYQDNYLSKNLNHAVPLLELTMTNGSTQTMIESGAMLTFLADLYPEKQLAPSATENPSARADYLQMLHFASSWMDMILWQIRLHEDLLPEDQRDSKTVKRYVEKFNNEIEPQLIARLSQQDYICGDNFSAADCIMCHNVMWAKLYDLCQDACFDAYLSRLSKRPSFLMAFADSDEFHKQVPEESNLAEQITG